MDRNELDRMAGERMRSVAGVDEIRARLDAITPGRWERREKHGAIVAKTDTSSTLIVCGMQDEGNEAFIAGAPGFVAYLLERLASADLANTRLHTASDQMVDQIATLRASLARAEADLATEKQLHAVAIKFHDLVVKERDLARHQAARAEAERDARPEITAEDAAHVQWLDREDAVVSRVRAALRAHAAKAAPVSDVGEDRIYPCDRCGKMRTKSEGGTVFTVCDSCWDDKDGTGRAKGGS